MVNFAGNAYSILIKKKSVPDRRLDTEDSLSGYKDA